jgi:broad specificity phosphatase PhoE
MARLETIKPVYDDRVREQEHGLSLLYNDWRVFQTMHTEQKELRDLMGPYWYQYPNGESVPMVRDRLRLVTDTLIREYSGANVWIVSHHITKLAFRANLERLSPEEFIRLDTMEKPVNCGVTIYRGTPMLGKNGKLVLESYNQCFWK